MKTIEAKTTRILLEISDIENALSEHYGKEVKIADVSCRIYVYLEENCVDWLEFSIDGEEWLDDSELWGEETFEEYFPTVKVRDMDVTTALKKLFDFDAAASFKSIEEAIS